MNLVAPGALNTRLLEEILEAGPEPSARLSTKPRSNRRRAAERHSIAERASASTLRAIAVTASREN